MTDPVLMTAAGPGSLPPGNDILSELAARIRAREVLSDPATPVGPRPTFAITPIERLREPLPTADMRPAESPSPAPAKAVSAGPARLDIIA